VHFGARELREVYAEPFRAAITEAGLATVMNSYSSVDGLACGASKTILDELLRGELGFTGAVVADYSTTELLISHHRVAADKAEAAQRALTAGLDMELPQLDCYGAPLKALVERGTVDIALVDRSVRRVLALKDALGLFDDPFVDEGAATSVYFRADDRALARHAAAESLVLLKNDGVLPLPRTARVAVIGPAADDERLLQGDYSYPAHTEIVQARDQRGQLIEATGNFAPGPYYPESVTPLSAMGAAAELDIAFAKGCGVRSARTDGFEEAVAIARAADVAVCFVGGRSGLMPDCTSGEFRDVSDLALPGVQEQLVAAVAASGTPTVVVVISGRPHALTAVVEHAAALLYAWIPGEQGGAAIADVLFGAVAPSGRLPVSLPRSAGQVPAHHDVRAGGGRSAIYGDYVDGPAAPLFPFGFGLGYTTFGYDTLVVADATTDAPIDVQVNVTNTGAHAGTEVVQLFARDDVARVARPERQLVAFTRVALGPGATHTARFRVDPTAFAYYDEDMRLVVEPGDVTFTVGPLQTTVGLAGAEREIAPNDRRPSTVDA
jgi:beta-glucosidase